MSNLVVFSIDEKSLKYEDLIKISKDLINLALEDDKGIIFNFLEYNNKLINDLNIRFYFTVSDTFFHTNSDFFDVCDIDDILENSGKEKMSQKFKIIDEIEKYFIKKNIKKYRFLFSSEESYDVKDYIHIDNNGKKRIIDILYEDLIKYQDINSFCFSTMLIVN